MLAEAGGGADSVARHARAVPGRLERWALAWLATAPMSALYAMARAPTPGTCFQAAAAVLRPETRRAALGRAL